MPTTSLPDATNRRLGWKLAAAALAMCGFGYLLVPLYQVYCKTTGFNGTTSRIDYADALASKPDASRLVTIEFVANTQGNLPWEFRPEVAHMQVHPGEIVLTKFHARNLGNNAIVGQAIPSVTPGQGAPYFHKVECFCFSRQPLAPVEGKELPVQFVVDPELPRQIGTLTLSYTFFDVPDASGDAGARTPAVAARR